jgi:hypothetical protein
LNSPQPAFGHLGLVATFALIGGLPVGIAFATIILQAKIVQRFDGRAIDGEPANCRFPGSITIDRLDDRHRCQWQRRSFGSVQGLPSAGPWARSLCRGVPKGP